MLFLRNGAQRNWGIQSVQKLFEWLTCYSICISMCADGNWEVKKKKKEEEIERDKDDEVKG